MGRNVKQINKGTMSGESILPALVFYLIRASRRDTCCEIQMITGDSPPSKLFPYSWSLRMAILARLLLLHTNDRRSWNPKISPRSLPHRTSSLKYLPSDTSPVIYRTRRLCAQGKVAATAIRPTNVTNSLAFYSLMTKSNGRFNC